MALQTYAGLFTAKSPIAHGSDEKAGVDTLFRRQRFMTASGPTDIPMISGNAIRGRLRRVAAQRYCTLAGLPDRSLPPWLYHALFAGGSIQKGSEGGKMGIADRRAVREHCPFLSLWGTAWKADILQGKLTVGMALPICRELEEFTGVSEPRSIRQFLDEIALTRKDDRENVLIATPQTDIEEVSDSDAERSEDPPIDMFGAVEAEPSSSPLMAAGEPHLAPLIVATPLLKTKGSPVQMLYRVEVLVPGTRFVALFILDDATEVEAACFADCLAAWRLNPTFGGKASGGFGRMDLEFSSGSLSDPEPYVADMAARADSIRIWLRQQGVTIPS